MPKVLPGQLELPFKYVEFVLKPQCEGGCVYVNAKGRLYGYCLKCGVPYVHTHDSLRAPNEK